MNSASTNLYTKINLDALKDAMSNPRLTQAEFYVWLLLAKNRDKYDYELSTAEAAKWGISKATFYRAINKLLLEKYLVPERKGSNHLQFYEYPQTQKDKWKGKQYEYQFDI